MSWRIETAGPLALMRELPDAWAQTCFLRPPRDLALPHLVAILDEAKRVLRDDGTVWVTLPGRGHPPAARAIEGAGWLRPRPGAAYLAGFRGPELFVKQPQFYFHPRPALATSRPGHRDVFPAGRLASCSSSRGCRPARRAWCVPARTDGGLSPSVIEWCILAGSSARACGICGAPCKRLPAAGSEGSWCWRAGCSHTHDRGRCLVLDPFCGPSPVVGVAAVRLGRSYLGADRHPQRAMRARRRLRETLPEPRQ
jgi:hypothetical protein